LQASNAPILPEFRTFLFETQFILLTTFQTNTQINLASLKTQCNF